MRTIETASRVSCEPEIDELERALNSINDGKAPGVDKMLGELLKYKGPKAKLSLWRLVAKL